MSYVVSYNILLYPFPSQHNNVKISLTFTVYNEFICLDGIAVCFGLWNIIRQYTLTSIYNTY
jgi:hypothetical protein